MGYATGSKNKKTTIDTHTGIIVHQSLFDIIAKTKVVTTEYRGYPKRRPKRCATRTHTTM